MTDRYPIYPGGIPLPIAPYSPAIISGHLLFTSVQLPMDPLSNTLVEGGFDAQVQQVFTNLQNVARGAGAELSYALKISIYLTDFDKFDALNQLYESFFTFPYPARSVIEVRRLALGAEIAAEGIFTL